MIVMALVEHGDVADAGRVQGEVTDRLPDGGYRCIVDAGMYDT